MKWTWHNAGHAYSAEHRARITKDRSGRSGWEVRRMDSGATVAWIPYNPCETTRETERRLTEAAARR